MVYDFTKSAQYDMDVDTEMTQKEHSSNEEVKLARDTVAWLASRQASTSLIHQHEECPPLLME